MLVISHRGYENGEDSSLENNPKQIKKLLNMNINVEIDVLYNDGFFLGHDKPLYEVEMDFLKLDGLWCHAKNVEALEIMLQNGIHCFWHETDKYTITSRGYIWAYPGMPLTSNSINVLPERYAKQFRKLDTCIGVCTDYPIKYIKGVKNGKQ